MNSLIQNKTKPIHDKASTANPWESSSVLLQPASSQHPGQAVRGAVGSLHCIAVPPGTRLLIYPATTSILKAACINIPQICVLGTTFGAAPQHVPLFHPEMLHKCKERNEATCLGAAPFPPQLWQRAWCQAVPNKRPLYPQAGGRHVPVRSLQARTDGECACAGGERRPRAIVLCVEDGTCPAGPPASARPTCPPRSPRRSTLPPALAAAELELQLQANTLLPERNATGLILT